MKPEGAGTYAVLADQYPSIGETSSSAVGTLRICSVIVARATPSFSLSLPAGGGQWVVWNDMSILMGIGLGPYCSGQEQGVDTVGFSIQEYARLEWNPDPLFTLGSVEQFTEALREWNAKLPTSGFEEAIAMLDLCQRHSLLFSTQF